MLLIDAASQSVRTKEGNIQSVVRMGSLEVDYAYYSDSIILWAVFDQVRFWSFCNIVADFFCQILRLGIPGRGGLSVGDAILDKQSSVFIGKALVEAQQVEAAQDWIGVSFGPSFAESPFRYSFHRDSVLMFGQHRKPGLSHLVPGVVLDWPRQWRKMYPSLSLRHYLTRINTDSRYARYYDMAVRFVEFSERIERLGPSSTEGKSAEWFPNNIPSMA